MKINTKLQKIAGYLTKEGIVFNWEDGRIIALRKGYDAQGQPSQLKLTIERYDKEMLGYVTGLGDDISQIEPRTAIIEFKSRALAFNILHEA